MKRWTALLLSLSMLLGLSACISLGRSSLSLGTLSRDIAVVGIVHKNDFLFLFGLLGP